MPSYRPQRITTCSRRRQPRRARPASAAALAARSAAPPAAAPRVARMCSAARKNGSGFITIPGPPPYGTSSTTRCRSVVKSRRSWTFRSMTPASTPRATTPSASGWSNIRGKIVTMSNFIADLARRAPIHVQQPCRRVDHDPLGRDVNRHADRGDQGHQNLPAPPTQSRAGVPRLALDRADRADLRPRRWSPRRSQSAGSDRRRPSGNGCSAPSGTRNSAPRNSSASSIESTPSSVTTGRPL